MSFFRTMTLLGLLASSTAFAQSKQQLFEQGNAAYFRGDYSTAIQKYEALIASGVSDPDVTFNLATAYARGGRYGQAIRYFERTRRLRPSDEDADHGLAAARTALGRRLAQQQGDAVVQTRPSFTDAVLGPFSDVDLGWTLLAFDALLFATLVLLAFAHKESLRLGLGISGAVLAVLCAGTGAGFLAKTEAFAEGVPAIVLTRDAQVREGPDPRARVRGALEEGIRARIVDRDGEYVLVHALSNVRGWMLARDIGRI